MKTEIKNAGQYIDLGDNFKLSYQKPEIFSKYHTVYYGQKYGQYYFRMYSDTLVDRANYLDSGYFILKDNRVIGGVFIKPNFMADLFAVPPYEDYDYLADKLLKYLKTISNKDEKILIQEQIEDHLPIFKSKGCVVFENGFWMIRPTELIEGNIPDGFESKSIIDEYKDEIADVIISAYKANQAIKSIDSKEIYLRHVVERFLEYNKDNSILYNGSKAVFSKATNEIVGVCLLMEFERLPLIMEFAVKPEYQGKGIGSYLIKHSISSTSTDYAAIRLFVHNHNSAMKLYVHMGFIKNKTLNDMYLLED